MERNEAESLLRTAVGDSTVKFREGQWEAIDALVNQRRKMLVVQRTGWGKSSVYFISTRILRDIGAGPTLIVSPLLALMRNQIEAARRLGIRAETINSSNTSEWESVKGLVLQNKVDALLISLERLSNEGFIEDVLLPIADRIGLLVVDEAHCISDWGHDFRPDYRRIVGILQQMPPNMPVLGTTATANDRVTGSPSQWLEGWSHKKITCERIEALLNRGMTLALSVEKWKRSGLWVMTRSDNDYPQRIKDRLGPSKSPHILFGCGNRRLLQDDGNVLAVVGSRDADDIDLAYSRDLGKKAANSGWLVVSGGARGVDEAAMLGALDAEGTVIGALADSLLKTSLSKKYLRHLMDNNLVLVSPFNPESGFNVGNAMGRNKYIYCMSDAAVVVRSDTKGGTWRGAEENQKNNWVPIWVKHTDDGNHRIVQRGANWLPHCIDEVDLSTLTNAEKGTLEPPKPSANNGANHPNGVPDSFYGFFLLMAERECSDSPKTVEQLYKNGNSTKPNSGSGSIRPPKTIRLRNWRTPRAIGG